MWVIVQTKAKQEARAKINLVNQGFQVYLPIYETKVYKSNKWIDRSEVLFSRYIFLKYNDANLNLSKINNTFGVSRLLFNNNESAPYMITDTIISQIKSRLLSNKTLNYNDLCKGDKVLITKGAMSNLNGIFIEKSGLNRSKVLIQMLSQTCSISVNTSYLKALYN